MRYAIKILYTQQCDIVDWSNAFRIWKLKFESFWQTTSVVWLMVHTLSHDLI